MAICSLLFAGSAFAMNVRAIVQDDAGKPVKDAVVYAARPGQYGAGAPPRPGGDHGPAG